MARLQPEDLRALPPAALAELGQLYKDGYVAHKLWANGVELRVGEFSEWKLALHLLLLVACPVAPFVMRSLVANLGGYRHRVFVTNEGAVRFV